MARMNLNLLLLATAASSVIADTNAPFFTLISDTIDNRGTERCGGVLIHPDIILTGVECVFEGFGARVGYVNDFESYAQIVIEDWSDHPDAWVVSGGVQFQEHLPNDLTVAKLENPVDGITPISLSDNIRLVNDRSRVHFAHAGNTYDITNIPGVTPENSLDRHPFQVGIPPEYWPDFSNELISGETDVKQFRRCIEAWTFLNEINQYSSALEEGIQFCIQPTTGVTPCDSHGWGSPIWVDNEETDGPTLVGLASQGQCASNSPLGFVITRIAPYYDWIQESICAMSDFPPASCPPTVAPTPQPTMRPTKQPTPSRGYFEVREAPVQPTPFPTFFNNRPTEPNCQPCTDTPNQYMINENRPCDVNDILIRERKCNRNAHWRNNKFCQASCFYAGFGYEGDVCC